MAVYLHIYNLIVPKKVIADKYLGGVEKFREDFRIGTSKINQEDDELFCLGQMNSDQLSIDNLVENGLHFDSVAQTSRDFCILARYGGFLCPVDWLEQDSVFAWHTATHPLVYSKMKQVSDLCLEVHQKLMAEGKSPLQTIRLDNLDSIHLVPSAD
jgi:hypothetical protein